MHATIYVSSYYYICVRIRLYFLLLPYYCTSTQVYKTLTLLEQARLPAHTDAASICNSCNKLQQQLQEHADTSITLREALAAGAERHRAHAQVLAKQRNGVY